MNARNISYISRYNPRSLYPGVDDKLQTKVLAEEAGIAVPQLYGVVRWEREVRSVGEMLEPYAGFAIKPTHGSAGKGVLVINEKKNGLFLKPSGQTLNLKEIERYVSNILSGLYSLGGQPDIAMIEALVEFSSVFKDYSFEGVPDIRVIVFRGFPVMAMMRLSTRMSDGKANLHQGAIGVGLNLATGRALRAVQRGIQITEHPDTGHAFDDLVVPQWQDLLRLAARATDMTGMGYIGADIVLDQNLGPLILELNARPGLAIQIANGSGLRPRLDWVESRSQEGLSVADRVAAAVEMFSSN